MEYLNTQEETISIKVWADIRSDAKDLQCMCKGGLQINNKWLCHFTNCCNKSKINKTKVSKQDVLDNEIPAPKPFITINLSNFGRIKDYPFLSKSSDKEIIYV